MKHLLIIDDEEDFAAFVQDVAEMQGYAVASANSVAEAKEAYEKFQPDVILLDMVMPDADGLKFLEWMKNISLRPRVIVISGFHQVYTSMASKFGEAYGLGPIQMLTKPISIGNLRRALEEASQAVA